MDQQKEIEGLRALVGALWKRLDDVTVLAETLREMLQRRGILSDQEIEASLAEGRAIQTNATLKAMRKALPAYDEDFWRQFLEKVEPKGPTQ